ncbi:MAG: lactate utilization protein B [bacterium]
MSRATRPKELKRQIMAVLKTRSSDPPFKKNTRKAVDARAVRVAEWPNFNDRRENATLRRQDAIDHLGELHAQLRQRWAENGITVHEAPDGEQAQTIALRIIRDAGAKRVVKSKSMLSEEIEINTFFEGHGIETIETDLGEYIVQLRGETPSHITMPAMHLSRQDIGRLFVEKLGVEYTEDPSALTQIVRRTLRRQFLSADVGIIGVNFAVAETGHLATVTNEGNGRMVTTLPKVVIALMGWERVTQSLDDLAQLWQLLSRSATGQRASVYLNLTHGPDPAGGDPRQVHVIVIDNGRKRIHEDNEMREVLRCIRCGACLNACPVYQQVGGHPYGGVYPGPIGAVFTPAREGIRNAPDHPFASSLCGACEETCPVSISIPKLLLTLRKHRVEIRSALDPQRGLWRVFREVMSSHGRYEAAAKFAHGIQSVWPGGAGKMIIPGWTDHRDPPAFAKHPFRELFQDAADDPEETDDA